MSEAGLVPFPVLPVELILLIFERLLHEKPGSALVLVLVSKNFQQLWVEHTLWRTFTFKAFCSIDPLLYATLIIRRPKALHALAFTIRDGTKPASFYKQHVKRFCVWQFYPNFLITHRGTQCDDFRVVFSACTSIESVAFEAETEFQCVPWEMLIGIRRLSICVHAIPNSFANDLLCNSNILRLCKPAKSIGLLRTFQWRSLYFAEVHWRTPKSSGLQQLG